MTLVWQRRRFVCDSCGNRHLEEHPEFEGNLTRRLARQIITDTRVMTISAVARREGLGWHKVMGLVTAWSNRIAEHRRRRPCRVLLIDETSIQRGHKYVTVIKNGDTGKTLDIVEHRSAAALAGFLRSQPRSWRRKVKVVVTDGSRPYKKAVDAWLPHARHVLDRFHVVRWFAAGLNAVRRDVQRRPEGKTSVFDPEVFRARFVLLRRPDRLTPDEADRLRQLLDGRPRLRAAWHALAELHGLYLARDYPAALAALRRFADLYASGELPEFDAVMETVSAWEEAVHRTRNAGAGGEITVRADAGFWSYGLIERLNTLGVGWSITVPLRSMSEQPSKKQPGRPSITPTATQPRSPRRSATPRPGCCGWCPARWSWARVYQNVLANLRGLPQLC